MPSKIQHKRAINPVAPSGLSFGELAFIQGSGNTAEQLYIGISGESVRWIGARIEDTVTDWTSKTRLATQAATVTKVNSLITSGAVQSFNGSTGAIQGVSSVNGSTGAITNVAITTNPLSQFASTTSSQLAGVISDETGSGALVFATSPTLVTPALGTPSALIGTNITGTATSFTASNVTTNANLTGHVTSTGNAAVLGSFTSAQLRTALSDETGTGVAVFATSPTLVTPTLGAATATTINKVIITPPFSTASITIADGMDFVVDNASVTLVGASPLGSNVTLPASGTLVTLTGTETLTNKTLTSPTLTTPALGTPSALVGTNITGTATAFTASNVTTNANLTGHVTSTGNAAVLGSFSSAQLATALSDETGSGAAVFATSPTLVTPALGTPSSGTLSSCTFRGSKTYDVFTPMNNQPPSTNYATIDTRNSIAVLEFDASTDEGAVFVGVMSEDAVLGSGLIVKIHWMADTATSGTVRWGVCIERMNTDEDSDSFDTAATGGDTTNGTSGIITTTSITITTIDSVAAGEPYRVKIYRDADGTSGTDSMSGDAQLVAVEVRSAS